MSPLNERMRLIFLNNMNSLIPLPMEKNILFCNRDILIEDDDSKDA